VHRSRRRLLALAVVAALCAPAASNAGAESATWHHVAPRGYPEARGVGHMVWDSARDNAVYFGGAGLDAILNETWTWDGAQWTQRAPAHAPPARRYFGMAYDELRHEAVVFGGESSDGGFLDDTWTWDGTDWTQRFPAQKPPARQRHAMSWDPLDGGVLLFGGIAASLVSLTGYSAVDDTWIWNGATWTQRVAPATPGPRSEHGMAYDAARNEVVLYGGTSAYASMAGPALNGTWVWNGLTWLLRAPDVCQSLVASNVLPDVPCAAPPARTTSDLVYDAARRRIVLFGGGGGFHKDDTWTWDGLLWTHEQPAHVPGARYGDALAYDPIRERVVMFGGHGTYGYMDDTWTWDGTDWSMPLASPVPPSRWDPSMVYDPIRHEVVLFGGMINDSRDRLNDTWTWDGVRWTRHETPVSPGARTNAAAGFYPGTGKLVMFGGDGPGAVILDDTWTWDGNTWEKVATATTPNRRTAARMALHESSGRLVMFGGWAGVQYLDDMWEWTGSDWKQLIPYNGSMSGLSPSHRSGHAMAYDPARDVVVVHDGNGAPSDTWTWNAVRWTKIDTRTTLPSRDEATLAPTGDGSMVLFGGMDDSLAYHDDTFLFDGADWSQAYPPVRPAARREHRMVWDAARHESVMFGGTYAFEDFNDTWVWGTDAHANTNAFPSASLSLIHSEGASATLSLGASDADGSIASWTLDTNYDGTPDLRGTGAPPATVTCTVAGQGARTVRFAVTDDFGDTRAAALTLPPA
jgi:hypothetical protein